MERPPSAFRPLSRFFFWKLISYQCLSFCDFIQLCLVLSRSSERSERGPFRFSFRHSLQSAQPWSKKIFPRLFNFHEKFFPWKVDLINTNKFFSNMYLIVLIPPLAPNARPVICKPSALDTYACFLFSFYFLLQVFQNKPALWFIWID